MAIPEWKQIQKMVMNERKANKSAEERRRLYQQKEWYTIRSLLGNEWALFYILLGARERGKSYSVMEYCLRQWKEKKKPFTWIRLSEASTKKMLTNNAAQMVDPDLMRRFDLDLKTKGGVVYDHGEKMATVLALSTAHNDKGVALFDNENDWGFNIVLDEFQLEKSQRRTFDVSYNLVVNLENLVRSRRDKIRIFMIGNTTEEASDILSMFNFIPQEFGVYKLVKHKNKLMELLRLERIPPKERTPEQQSRIDYLRTFDYGKRAVVDYMPNSEAYNQRRKGTVGDILAGHTSNFTNNIETDVSLIHKGRLKNPQYVIRFSKDRTDWFTVWEGNIVAKWNKEIKPSFGMKRYIDTQFNPELRDQVFAQQDARAFYFKDLLTQKQFIYQLSLVKRQ